LSRKGRAVQKLREPAGGAKALSDICPFLRTMAMARYLRS
jgi:hypothetical protein